jgi:hypothetical protein
LRAYFRLLSHRQPPTRSPRRRRAFTYRKIGANAYGEEITGKFSDEIDLNHVVTELTAFLEAAVRECRPQYLRSEFTKNSGRHLKFEEIGLPLSNDGQNVDMLLCRVRRQRAHGISKRATRAGRQSNVRCWELMPIG